MMGDIIGFLGTIHWPLKHIFTQDKGGIPGVITQGRNHHLTDFDYFLPTGSPYEDMKNPKNFLLQDPQGGR